MEWERSARQRQRRHQLFKNLAAVAEVAKLIEARARWR
jgi:hypothetical protein